jgi:hypothetical protein
VRPVDGLCLRSRSPPGVEEEDVLRRRQVESHAAGLEADQEEPALGVVLEALHSAVAVARPPVEVLVRNRPGIEVLPQNPEQARELGEDQRLVALGRELVELIDEEGELGARLPGAAPVDQARVEAKGLQFNLPGGFDGDLPTVGDAVQYEIQLLPGESANGADDNGNGLVDEAQLLRRNSTTGEAVVLSGEIDYTESSFSRNGDAATITIATVGTLPDRESSFSLSRSLTVYARN